MLKEIEVTYTDDNGDENVDSFPAKYEVCGRCDGEGKHVNPNIDGHGISAEEWENEWDEESRENYFNGVYDVICEKCNGKRVVLVPIDPEAMTQGQRIIYEIWCEQQRSDREMERMYEAERRYGC